MPRSPDAQTPRCPDAQMSRRPDAQMPRRPDAQTCKPKIKLNFNLSFFYNEWSLVVKHEFTTSKVFYND